MMEPKDIARVAHEACRALLQIHGDQAQPAWHAAPVWVKKTMIDAVEFLIANPEAGYKSLQDNWLAEKIRDGWKLGKKKDAERKTHPFMVPFDQLPKEQQLKDQLIWSIVAALT